MKRLFVTGTDTGVGKTTVTRALAHAAARRGLRVAAMKPCETGDGDDAARLSAACGRPLDPALVCPFRFPLPASPEVAARAAGQRLDFGRIIFAYEQLCRDADLVLVEGAGGLLVPLGGGLFMADLARRLDLPLLVVARASLGTVNHTLLTLEAARQRRLRVAGVVLSRSVSSVGDTGANAEARAVEATNPEAIARHGETPIFGCLPYIENDIDLYDIAEQTINIDHILQTI